MADAELPRLTVSGVASSTSKFLVSQARNRPPITTDFGLANDDIGGIDVNAPRISMESIMVPE